jgi:hypothetical protein
MYVYNFRGDESVQFFNSAGLPPTADVGLKNGELTK